MSNTNTLTTLRQPLKYSLCLIELHNPRIHGNIEPYNGNWLVNDRYDIIQIQNNSRDSDNVDEDDANTNLELLFMDILAQIQMIQFEYTNFYTNTQFQHHPFIRNYVQIVRKIPYLEIAEIYNVIDSAGDRIVLAVLKTFWLRIFQRKWRKYMMHKQLKIKMRKMFASILEREYRGKFPRGCRYM